MHRSVFPLESKKDVYLYDDLNFGRSLLLNAITPTNFGVNANSYLRSAEVTQARYLNGKWTNGLTGPQTLSVSS